MLASLENVPLSAPHTKNQARGRGGEGSRGAYCLRYLPGYTTRSHSHTQPASSSLQLPDSGLCSDGRNRNHWHLLSSDEMFLGYTSGLVCVCYTHLHTQNTKYFPNRTRPSDGAAFVNESSASSWRLIDTGEFKHEQIGHVREVTALASGVSIPQGEAPISPCRNQSELEIRLGQVGVEFQHPNRPHPANPCHSGVSRCALAGRWSSRHQASWDPWYLVSREEAQQI